MEHLPAGMRKEEEAVLSPEAVCVGEHWEGWPQEGGCVWAVALCVVMCTSPVLPQAAGRFSPRPRGCGQKAGDQPSGRHLWALNSPLSYAPQTMGPFLHTMGMRDPVMDL